MVLPPDLSVRLFRNYSFTPHAAILGGFRLIPLRFISAQQDQRHKPLSRLWRKSTNPTKTLVTKVSYQIIPSGALNNQVSAKHQPLDNQSRKLIRKKIKQFRKIVVFLGQINNHIKRRKN